MRNLNEYIKEGLLGGDVSKVKADIGEIAFNRLQVINSGSGRDAGVLSTQIVPEVIEMIQSDCEEIDDWKGDGTYFNKGTFALIYPDHQQLRIFIRYNGEGRRSLYGVLFSPGYNYLKSCQEPKDFKQGYKYDYIKLYKISDKQLDFYKDI